MKFVLASRNAKKMAELAALFAPLGCQLVSQASLGVVDEAAEPHPTFVENALAKARHASLATGRPAIADDSGLCVDALGGAPGVQSARYAQLAPPSPSPQRTAAPSPTTPPAATAPTTNCCCASSTASPTAARAS